MYRPQATINTKADEILEIIEKFPLATVMSYDDTGKPFFSHLPLIARRTLSDFTLVGHLATQNPQSSQLRANPLVRVIFHGPSAYISPTWYCSGTDVPTWNYVVVHIDGNARLTQSAEELVDLLKAQAHHFERDFPEPWRFQLPEDLATPSDLTNAIVGFEIEITNIEAKFKLAQRKPANDRASVVENLRALGESGRLSIADLMARPLRS